MIQLSVVIPCYNVSTKVDRCARSLMEQTKQEGIEFIFVDDCSTDSSLQILRQTLSLYPARQSQIHVIPLTQHVGVGGARRRGMSVATGEYVIHCDADDWVDTEAYQILCDKIAETQADVVICPLIHEFLDYRYVEKYRPLPVASCFTDQRWWSLCSHAVRRSIILQHHIDFSDEITFWEDSDFLLRVIVYAHTIAYLSVPFYHYDRTSEQSMMHQNKGDAGFHACQQVIVHLTEFFQHNAPQHISSLALLRRAARDLYLEGRCPDLATWSRTYPETWPLVWKNRDLSLAYRLCYVLGSYRIVWPMRCLLFIARRKC